MRPSLFDVYPTIPPEILRLQSLNIEHGNNEIILDHELRAFDCLCSIQAHIIARGLFVNNGKALTELPSIRIEREFAAIIELGHADYFYERPIRRNLIGIRAEASLIEFHGVSRGPIDNFKTALQEQTIVEACASLFIPVAAITHMEFEL